MKSNMSFALSAVAVLAAAVAADKIPDFVVSGKCPAVDETKLWEEQKPRHSQFGGVWYQHSLTPNTYQPLEECVRIEYNFDGEGFNVKGSGLNADGDKIQTKGEAYPMPLGDPHLMVAVGDSFPAPLVILDTDYSNYACLYSCMEYNSDYYSDFAFVFSRQPSLDESHLKKCESAFKKISVDLSRFNKTPQGSECSY